MSKHLDASRWQAAAQAWNLPIPEEQIRRITPVLDDLAAKAMRALDRDLSLTEPVCCFRPSPRRA